MIYHYDGSIEVDMEMFLQQPRVKRQMKAAQDLFNRGDCVRGERK